MEQNLHKYLTQAEPEPTCKPTCFKHLLTPLHRPYLLSSSSKEPSHLQLPNCPPVKNSVEGLVAQVAFEMSILLIVELLVVLTFAVLCRSIKPLGEKRLAGS